MTDIDHIRPRAWRY